MTGFDQPSIAAITTCFDRPKLVERFLRAFECCHRIGVTLTVVHHGGCAQIKEFLEDSAKRIQWLRVIEVSEDVWWTGAINIGLEEARKSDPDTILTINSDSVPGESFIDCMREAYRQKPGWILVPCQLRSDDQRVIRSLGSSVEFKARHILPLRYAGEQIDEISKTLPKIEEIRVAPGNGVLWPCDLFKRVGCFDEDQFVHYHADTDLMFRAGTLGYRVGVVVDARIVDDTSRVVEGHYLLWHVTSEGSPRQWRGLCTLLWRHGPRLMIPWILVGQWVPFCFPAFVQRAFRSKTGRK